MDRTRRRPLSPHLTMLGIAALIAAATGVGLGHARVSRAPSAPAKTLRERLHEDSLRFVAGVGGGQFDSLQAVFRRDAADARRQHDDFALLRLLVFQGAGHAMVGDARAAVPVLDEALTVAEAEHDTTWTLVALRWRTYAAGMLGRRDEQNRLAERLVSLAEVSGSPKFVAIGNNFLGWIARERGDLKRARQCLERAVEGHRALRNEAEEAFARTAYGATLMDLGEYAAARKSYARQLEIARRLHQGYTEALAYNDLGVLELHAGDPRRAIEFTHRAYDAFRVRGAESPDAVAALNNLAARELDLGRAAAAADLGREGLAIAERRGFVSQRGTFLILLATAEERLEHSEAAIEFWYRALAMSDSIPADLSSYAVLGLSRSLVRAGRATEAAAILEGSAKTLLPRLPPEDLVRFESGWSDRLYETGRYRESLAMGLKATEAARGLPPEIASMGAWDVVALSHWRLGHGAEASAAFDSARAHWERRRLRSQDLEWRTSSWASSGEVSSDNVAFLLSWPSTISESDRIAAAYERAQAFRTRALLDRASRGGPVAHAERSATWTLRRVQQEILGDGELLLEWDLGSREAWVFAVTRDERKVFRLGKTEDLERKRMTACALMAQAPPGSRDHLAAEAASRELARRVFGGALPMVEKARSLLLVPDQGLHLVPFAALIATSSRGARAIAVVPSVGILGESRRRPLAPMRSHRMLAVAPGATGARPLAGAEHEVSWLTQAFDGVERAPDRVDDPEAWAPTLAPYEALHFAGHATLDDRFPWRSGIDVGAMETSDPMNAEASSSRQATPSGELLRAETIAATPIAARLVVLASCQTAAGSVSGEGVAGLSTAFLAAGARSVVASLWPVDDRATETLMREFYRALASGKNAGAALHIAQERVRRSASTRHPYYWAGFVVIGDGRTTLPLTPTPLWKRVLDGKGLGNRDLPRRPKPSALGSRGL